IVRSRRLNVLRRIAGFVAAVSIVWIVLYSLPFMIHFGGLLRSPQRIESKVLKEVGGDRQAVYNAYRSYSNNWLVGKMFSEYQAQAKRMKEIYSGIGPGSDVEKLDDMIAQLAGVVGNEETQPKYEQAKKNLIRSELNERLLYEIKAMRAGDEKEVTDRRAGRVLYLWRLYEQCIKNPTDAAIQDSIWTQVDADAKNTDCSNAEREMGKALLRVIDKSSPQSSSTRQTVDASLGAYEDLKSRINDEKAEPEFVLGEAVANLEAISGTLMRGVHDKQISAISSFVAEAKQWEKRRTYSFRLLSVPDDGHIHYEVTEPGENPRWNKAGTQYMQGEKIDLEWQPGDEIHIAFDAAGAEEQWGKSSTDMIVLRDTYALFEMDGFVTLLKGNRIQFSYKGGLRQQLPKLK
ncbi:MAG: hypothetical protein NTW97_05045, partial [Candidatus Krumholzibacteria bacterium]|nr:hypothetical protein [Candidatus Krumholzibacteria bacterium]